MAAAPHPPSAAAVPVAHTFAVADVPPAREPLAEVPYREAVEAALGGRRIESCPARLHRALVPAPYHPFVHAVHLAFDGHRPLALAPDHIWLLICQGFAAHVNANAEALRPTLVNFEGKRTISVRRDDFVKGAMENPWEEVFPEFIHKLRAFLGDAADLLTPRFSTTGPVETAACQITLMDAVRPFFRYEFATACGIPRVTLEGTADDWAALRGRAEAFRRFGLGWWLDPLGRLLDQFAAAAAGRPDHDWWASFYKWDVLSSGGPFVNGHALKLFPYVKDYRSKAVTARNPYLPADRFADHGLTAPDFPTGLSAAPFVWDYRGRRDDYEFAGGFVGVRQSDDLTVRPEIGWAVHERGEA